MHLRFTLITLFLFPLFLAAQIDQDFNLNTIDELSGWSGDLDDFLINDNQQLQLNATKDGSSILTKSINISDLVEWQFYFNLEFAPSSSNRLRIYLLSDSDNLAIGNAYFIEVGESGSQDNLQFYRQDQGDLILLAEGSMGALAKAPAIANVKITRNDDHFWTIHTAYDDDPFVQLEIDLSDSAHRFSQGYFGIQCVYTETRKDKFFFDDFYVGDVREDTEPPVLISAKFLDPQHIILDFNELVSESSALDVNNYSVNNLGNPTDISFGDFENQLILELSNPAVSGEVYDLSITDIEDLSGNQFNEVRMLYLTFSPSVGDLIINEVLFDPYPEGEDFIELYNLSTKFLDLSGLTFLNNTNDKTSTLTQELILGPKQYIAITPSEEALYRYYMTQGADNIIESNLPALNNSDGNVTILLEGIDGIIDSYSYDENDHSVWIDDSEGVSLERIDPAKSASESNNWQSASRESGFATPGYQNSNYSQSDITEAEFTLAKKTFSPDGDGFDDYLELNYRVSTEGFVLNMKVFDDRGHLIRTVANNEILSREGSVIWNGENDNGTLAGLGIYVIWLEYFNSEGTIVHKKLSCVLAKQLN